MNHLLRTPLAVYRVGSKRDNDNLFNDRKSGKVAELKCHVIRTETTEKIDTKPVEYIVKKTIGVEKTADVRISDEVVLFGRRYLVADTNPRRHWMELLAICEVKGHDR